MSKRGSKWTGMKPDENFSKLDPSATKIHRKRLLGHCPTQTISRRTQASTSTRQKWGTFVTPSLFKVSYEGIRRRLIDKFWSKRKKPED